jgi:hypothetical protein
LTPAQRKKIEEAFDAEYKKIPQGIWDEAFGLAPIKQEGQAVDLGITQPKHPTVDTTWIEFPLPSEWESECRAMIDKWLAEKIKATNINWEI